jgi:hypothetical protein
LVVSGRLHAQLYCKFAGNHLAWQQITIVKRLTVGGQRIDLVLAISTSYITTTTCSTSTHVNVNDIAVECCPFALHPEHSVSEIEGEVVDLMLRQRFEH